MIGGKAPPILNLDTRWGVRPFTRFRRLTHRKMFFGTYWIGGWSDLGCSDKEKISVTSRNRILAVQLIANHFTD
jgi:hypothetical protein